MDELGIEWLDIDPHVDDKLWHKHGVRFVEVEQMLEDERAQVRRVSTVLREIYGRTDEGRHLLVVVADKGRGQFKIVTARDMTKREVQWFERR